jgi:hypothetical protein
VARQCFAQQTNRAGIDAVLRAAVSRATDRVAEPTRRTELLDERPAGVVYVRRVVLGDVPRRPDVQFTLEPAVVFFEERPVEVSLIADRRLLSI